MNQPGREPILIGMAAAACVAMAWHALDSSARKPPHSQPASAMHAETLPQASPIPVIDAPEMATSAPPPAGRAIDSASLRLAEATAARLRLWEDQDDPDLREARMHELEELLRGADIQAVLQALPPELLNFALGLPTLQRWMADRPQEAAAWMGAHADTIAAGRVRQLADSWRVTDPTGLRGYITSLEDGAWKQEMIATLSTQAAKTDPREALDWAAQMQPGARQTGALEAAASAWIKLDPEAARGWVSQLRDRELRERLTGQLAAESAGSDPVFAARWAMQSLRPGDALNRSLADIAAAWAEKDPAAASEWVGQFPAGKGQRSAVSRMVNAWGNLDRPAAAAWIESLPDEAARKRAAALLATLPNAGQP